ncbi:hypothetical protein [Maliponia aquimaris]|uniref:Lipoprotein n=1 Tax=Maliponia aquimaris TaxID=1673631 RepID=A0A238L5G8_9RHOB|nr:hypothetical protein [Maliponia aquimaris]SMX50061.1 hypothetical protein MAA8898_04582 [Maliponia aquimaris]
MRIQLMAAAALVTLGTACSQPEPEPVYVQVPYDKYGGVAGGTIVDGYYVLDDGTVVGPVSPDVIDGNQNRNRNREQTQSQVQATTQTTTTQRTRTGN